MDTEDKIKAGDLYVTRYPFREQRVTEDGHIEVWTWYEDRVDGAVVRTSNKGPLSVAWFE